MWTVGRGGEGVIQIIQGDWIERLKELPDASVRCCVTSPPYWGLRNYGVVGQLGLEKSPEEYVAKLVAGFAEVRRVIEWSGTLWLNLGDCYATGAGSARSPGGKCFGKQNPVINANVFPQSQPNRMRLDGLKAKDLIGIPWMVAFALRSSGWYLRSEITWCKKVSMPESVQDRPTCATEKLFLLTKSPRYYYDADAVRNPPSESFANDKRWKTGSTPENEKLGYEQSGAQNPKQLHRMFDKQRGYPRRHAGFNDRWDAMTKEQQTVNGSNMRNFWVLGPEPCKEAHFATFPSEIPKRCILAGSRPGDTVLDPFLGSGTTGKVALELGRKFIGVELNPEYVEIAKRRTNVTFGLKLA